MRVTECRRPVRRVEVGVRPRRLRRLLAAVAAGAVLAGTGIGWAGRAHADGAELLYLQLLNERGLVVDDTAAALTTGHAVCVALNTATGDVVAARLYEAAYPRLSVAGAAIVVISAVEALCPWHDHRGETRL